MRIGTHYEIRSKLKPSLLLMAGWSTNVNSDIQKHKYLLAQRIHPVTDLMNHLDRFGLADFDFIIDEPEKAVIEVLKESRRGRVKKNE